MGTYQTGCYLADFCVSGRHDCSSTADCFYLGPGQFRCEVSLLVYLADFCASGRHDCSSTADCVNQGPGQFRCKVSLSVYLADFCVREA